MSISNQEFQTEELSRRIAGKNSTRSWTGMGLKLFVSLLTLTLLVSCNSDNDSGNLVELTFTEGQGDQTMDVWRALELDRKMPDVSIIPQAVPPSMLNFEPYVLSLSTGSSAIDAYLLDSPWVKRYSATDWLRPINYKNDTIDLGKFRDDLLDVVSINSEDGRMVLAVPFETKGNILFFRKDLLEKHNLHPPKTWDELISHCNKISQDEPGGGPRFGFLYHASVFINDYYPVLWSFGGDILDGKRNINITTRANHQALNLFKKLTGSISPSAHQIEELNLLNDYRAIDRIFAAGEAIFMINWNTRWQDLKNGLDNQVVEIEDIGVTAIPTTNGNDHYSNIGSFCWGINQYSSHPEEATDLINYLTSFDAQKWRALNLGIIPSRWDVLRDEQIIAEASDVTYLAEVFDKIKLKARPFQREINDILNSALISAIMEDLDSQEVLKEAERNITEALGRLDYSRRHKR